MARQKYLASSTSLLLTLVLWSNHIYVNAETFGSHHRYAAYDYDLTTPQFTPDGRLLQVEYATNACRREGSNPIVSVGIGIPSERMFGLMRKRRLEADGSLADDEVDNDGLTLDDDGDTILVMATVSSTVPMDTSTNNPEEDDQNSVVSSRGEVNVRTQYRIIEVPVSAAYYHTIDPVNPKDISAITSSTILVGMSGHLSDATSLLQIIYSQLEEEQSTFGWHRLGMSPVGQDISISDTRLSKVLTQSRSTSAQPTETVLRLARAAADQCQKHAFGGGLRPIGASILLSAVDTQSNKKTSSGLQQYGQVAMCETDPSGSVRSLVSSMGAESSAAVQGVSLSPPQVMVSGGSAKSQSTLKSLLESRLLELYQQTFYVVEKDNTKGTVHRLVEPCNKDLYTRKALQAVLSALLEESKTRQDPQLTKSSFTLKSSTSRFRKYVGHDKTSTKLRASLPQMEVVFVSSKRGSFRLTDKDLYELMRECLD